MNDFIYDPAAVRQQPVYPTAFGQQPMPTAAVQSKMGLVADPLAPTPQNAAMYNNARAITTGVAMFGSPEMRQNSVMMTQGQEEAFGPGGHSENPGLYKELK